MPALHVLFIVLHAPSSDDPEHLRQWWLTTTRAIPSHCADWPWIVLTDANARLGQFTSPCVGSAGATEETIAGMCFHEWLQHHNLVLPQTFLDHHEGDHTTWQHTGGLRSRLDYVAISHWLLSTATRTWVSEQIDLALQRRDHDAVCASLLVPYTKPKMVQPHCAPDLPAPTSVPTASTDIHTHAALLHAQLRARAPKGPTAKPRKAHMSAATWEVVRCKRDFRRQVRDLRQRLRHALLRQGLLRLRPQHYEAAALASSQVTYLRRSLAWAEWSFDILASRTTSLMRADDRHFYNDLVARAGLAEGRGSKDLWNALRPVLPTARRKRTHSLKCIGPSLDQLGTHFSSLEAAFEQPFSAILDSCHARQQDQAEDIPLTAHLADFPTRLSLERLGARRHRGQAPGPDGLTPMALREQVASMAGPFTLLCLKSWAIGIEPVQWKGGIMFPIAKGDNLTDPTKQRGIVLIDTLGRIFHAALRQHLLKVVTPWRTPLQLGGFRHQQTLFGTQMVRAVASLAQARGLSHSTLFIDLRSAFHFLIREQMFGYAATLPGVLRDALSHLDIDPAEVEAAIPDLSQRLCHVARPLLRRLLADAHQSTWFHLQGSESQTWTTTRGSRPGSPIADLVFNSMISGLLEEVQHRLRECVPLQEGCTAMGLDLPLVAWVDDMTISVVVPEASQLEEATRFALHAVHAAAQRRGMSLNLEAGKTECVCSWRGPLAPRMRQQHLVEAAGLLPLDPMPGHLRIVGEYKHLGTAFNGIDITSEIVARISKATKARRMVLRPILANRHIGRPTRLRLLDSLVGSVLWHGCGNWPLLPNRSFTKINHLYVQWIRSILHNGAWTPDMLPDDLLLAMWKLPPMSVRLARSRMLYAFQLWEHGPPLLWDYLRTLDTLKVPTWLTALRHALSWAHDVEPSYFPEASAVDTAATLFQWIGEHCHDGPRRTHRMVSQYLAQQHALALVRGWHKRLYDIAEDLGVTFHSRPTAPALVVDRPHLCDRCGTSFPSLQKLRVHQWMTHQMISDERSLIDSNTCRACGFCYWTPVRLQQHLHHSRRHPDGCFAQLTWNCQPSRVPADFVLPPHLQGHHRVPRVPRDLPRPASWFTSRAQAEDHLQRLWEEWNLPTHLDLTTVHAVATWMPQLLTPSSATTDASIDESLTQIMEWLDGPEEEAVCHTRAWALFKWRHTIYEADKFVALVGARLATWIDELDMILEALPIGQLLCWQKRMQEAWLPVLEPPLGRPALTDKEPIPYWTKHQTAWLQQTVMRTVEALPDCTGIPVVVDEDGNFTMYFLHLYSGRRRRGDCHDWLSAFGPLVFGGVRVVTLSLDTAICPVTGNLADGANFERVLSFAKRGMITATLSGPPCETWSAVRNVPAPPNASRRFPRPLRTAANPWCLPDRTPRETLQTAVGSSLMGHTWLVETSVVLHGGASVKEHPAPAVCPDFASVWRVPTHQDFVMQMPAAHQHVIEQWLFAAKGVKPTTLRTLGCGDPAIFEKALYEHADRTLSRPVLGLVGKDSNGGWKTSKAKEYPVRLCRAMSWALLQSLRQRLEAESFRPVHLILDQSDREWLLTAQTAATRTGVRDTWLPDYQG
eukprot:Skav211402  [mRNA]  locus=scaffold1528:200522:205297:- [translate_table: standard]